MNVLVAYYSRTGTTAKIAKEIAATLKCDIEEIFDQKNRKGMLGWIFAGSDGMSKQTTAINKPKYDPSAYDLVVIGTPLWVNATPAIRTYMGQHASAFKKVAFFCTMGGSGGKKLFLEMEQLAGKKPVATMDLIAQDVQQGSYRKTLDAFISKLK